MVGRIENKEINYSEFYKECKQLNNSNQKMDWDHLYTKYGFKTLESARGRWKNYRKKNGMLPGMYQKDKLKILHLSDFHFPYNVPIDTFSEYKNKVDLLVLNGDLQDCQAISKFPKKYRVPFIDELVGTREYVINLINLINPKKVIINFGNHEIRLLNNLNDTHCEEIMSLMPKSSLSLICETGFWKYDHKNSSKTFYNSLIDVYKDKEIIINYTDNWYCRVGKTIFAHPSAYRNGSLKTSEQAYLHFLQKGEELFDCLVLAHVHHQGFARYGKTYLYEGGCLCEEMDYTDMRLSKPQSQGFLYMVQDDKGNFIYSESKMICL